MFFASLHSSKRKFAPAQYVNRQRFLSPYLHSLFVICSSALATRTVFCSLFVHCLFIVCSLFVHCLFIVCSFIVRSLFVYCSSFVRLLFVYRSSFVRHLFVFCLSACRATTACVARTCLSCYDLAPSLILVLLALLALWY